MITFLYLLICWLSGDITVRMDILYVTAIIDIALIIGEVIVKLYETKAKWID